MLTDTLTSEEFDNVLHNYHILTPRGNLRTIFLNNKHLKA